MSEADDMFQRAQARTDADAARRRTGDDHEWAELDRMIARRNFRVLAILDEFVRRVAAGPDPARYQVTLEGVGQVWRLYQEPGMSVSLGNEKSGFYDRSVPGPV